MGQSAQGTEYVQCAGWGENMTSGHTGISKGFRKFWLCWDGLTAEHFRADRVGYRGDGQNARLPHLFRHKNHLGPKQKRGLCAKRALEPQINFNILTSLTAALVHFFEPVSVVLEGGPCNTPL